MIIMEDQGYKKTGGGEGARPGTRVRGMVMVPPAPGMCHPVYIIRYTSCRITRLRPQRAGPPAGGPALRRSG